MDFFRINKILILIGKIFCIAFAALCLICSLIPLIFYRHFNAGNLALLCYGILLNVVVFIKGKRNSEKLFRKVLYWMRIIISACLAICFVTGAVISCFMIKYAILQHFNIYQYILFIFYYISLITLYFIIIRFIQFN